MTVYWLELTRSDVPQSDSWLSENERVRLSAIRFPKRRADWRLGRWTAKHAVAEFLNAPARLNFLSKIEIFPAASGAPRVYLADTVAPLSISITHSDDVAACAVSAPEAVLGCDIEKTEPRSDGFVRDYFTDEERRFLATTPEGERSKYINLIWSAKESALKALEEGLRLDTRSVSVRVINGGPVHDSGWHPLEVDAGNDGTFAGWYQFSSGDQVRTMVAVPSPAPPILLDTQRLLACG